MALAFVLALPIYFYGAAPTVLDGDTAEMQAVGFLGGVAHPTGYPLFVMIARVFGALGRGDPAFRITFVSIFFAAVALSLLVLVLVELGLGAFNALLGAAILGSTFTFWGAAQRAEVYSIAFCVFLLALWRSILALRGERFRDALVAAMLLGLSACGHLMFGPLIALLGVTLAWHTGVRRGLHVGRLLALLAAFVLGLTPYLYIPWADGHGYAMDYLRLVDLANHPLGRPASFHRPDQRLAWLLLGRDQYPSHGMAFDPRSARRYLAWGIGHVALFEPGPLALIFALWGVVRLRARDPRMAALMVTLAAGSLLFSAAFAPGPTMLPIFLMPAVLMISIGSAWGLEPLIARLNARRTAVRVAGAGLLVLAPVVMSLTAQAVRVAAAKHPFTRLHLRVVEENGETSRDIVPSMRGEFQARRIGEAAMAVIPQNALVVGHWKEMMVLFYLRFVEGKRPDLTFQPLKYPTFLPRLTQWQAQYSLTERPIVFLQPHADMGVHFAALDSVRSAAGEWIVVARQPLRGLPPIAAAEP